MLGGSCSPCCCPDGACCNGSSCAVISKCDCEAAGHAFQGAGTTCSPSPCCGCLVSIAAKVPMSATVSSDKGLVLTRESACNCQIVGYPFFLLGLLCTSSGMRINATFVYGIAPVARLWSPLVSLATNENCGTFVPSLNWCSDSDLGAEAVNCGALGWPTSTTTFTRSDFSDASAAWNPTPYGSLSSEQKQVFDDYFPEYVSVIPGSNPLP